MTAFLEERAVLYTSGALTPSEREDYELILEFHDALRAYTCRLAEMSSSIILSGLKAQPFAPGGCRDRVLSLLDQTPQQITRDAVVMCGPDELVRWINPAFSDLCGYEISELAGKKLGPVLQGKETDQVTIERMRQAIRSQKPCSERILNYHKDGSSYWVDISLRPIQDNTGELLWFVARERKIKAPVQVG